LLCLPAAKATCASRTVGWTRKQLITVFEALYSVEKDKRLLTYLKGLRKGQRKDRQQQQVWAGVDGFMMQLIYLCRRYCFFTAKHCTPNHAYSPAQTCAVSGLHAIA
jgi:hypothetical protein